MIGGRPGSQGGLGAFISKVKKGSIADTVGHLRPGERLDENCMLVALACAHAIAGLKRTTQQCIL